MEDTLVPDSFSVKSIMRNYAVEFVADFTDRLSDFASPGSFFIVDTKVFDLYRHRIERIIPAERLLLVEATESHKTLEYGSQVIKTLIEKKIRRNTVLVAVGGGIIQDITAFVSSIFLRGIEWVFFPTTLLAQADSCIGSKTSINFSGYKNILGNFYPPSKVFIDLGFLESLSENDIKSGIGEMLHYYFIAGSPWAKKIDEEYDQLFAEAQCKNLHKYIRESLMIKKEVIERDEFDKGERNLFNYGHTFGHAIETLTDYMVSHGQAVTLGMDIANYISWQRGMLDQAVFNDMRAILMKNMPAFEITQDSLAKYLEILAKDKKNVDNELVCILTEGPGRMKKVRLPLDDRLGELILVCFERRVMKVS